MAMRNWGAVRGGYRFICDHCGHEECASECPEKCPHCGTPAGVALVHGGEGESAWGKPTAEQLDLTEPLPEPEAEGEG